MRIERSEKKSFFAYQDVEAHKPLAAVITAIQKTLHDRKGVVLRHQIKVVHFHLEGVKCSYCDRAQPSQVTLGYEAKP